MKLLAIDPGNIKSAFVIIDEDIHIYNAEKTENEALLKIIVERIYDFDSVVIEQIRSYGMSVGASVFDTCEWTGRFLQATVHNGYEVTKIPRQEVKLNVCKSPKAKDGNVIQALIDRFAPDTPNKGKGTKKEPGFFYGFAADVWQAFALGVTFMDTKHKPPVATPIRRIKK